MSCYNHYGRGSGFLSTECGATVTIQGPAGPMIPEPPPKKAPGLSHLL